MSSLFHSSFWLRMYRPRVRPRALDLACMNFFAGSLRLFFFVCLKAFLFFLLRLALSIYSCLFFSDSFEPWYESCHLHAYTFTLSVKKIRWDVYWICALTFIMVLRHGQTFFLSVNLEYNKYKLRTAFDETKIPSHLCTLCCCCDSADVCVERAVGT